MAPQIKDMWTGQWIKLTSFLNQEDKTGPLSRFDGCHSIPSSRSSYLKTAKICNVIVGIRFDVAQSTLFNTCKLLILGRLARTIRTFVNPRLTYRLLYYTIRFIKQGSPT